jgi:hypothetical protein
MKEMPFKITFKFHDIWDKIMFSPPCSPSLSQYERNLNVDPRLMGIRLDFMVNSRQYF